VVAGIDMADDRYFFVFAAVCLALVSAMVLQVRGATTGRFLDAVRGSEAAAVAVGISPLRQRVVAFALAAGIAGFGGGLIASWTGSASYDESFNFTLGLVWVVLVVTMGARSIQAALWGGLAFYLFPELLQRLPLLPSDWANGLSIALFGLGALTYARHPEGIIEANAARVVARFTRSPGEPAPRRPAAPVSHAKPEPVS
jgi:ABC-type branched-subunit amino acid transport system permease subunit